LGKVVRYLKRTALLLIIAGMIVAGMPPRRLSARLPHPAGNAAQGAQEQEPPSGTERPERQLQEMTIPSEVASQLEAFSVPSALALAKALNVASTQTESLPQSAANSLAVLGDLDGDGIAEAVLKWRIPELEPEAGSALPKAKPIWELFLLAWDGSRWHASQLMAGAETFSIRVIHLGKPARQGIVVTTIEGPADIPSPEVFQVKDHEASLLWDAQSDESRYEGYQHGRIEFRDTPESEATEMIVTGRADPGLLVFHGDGPRGFTARAVYRWDGQAYIPGKVEYSENQDYTLYRFISALHLRDFRAAYTLIQPAKFLGTDEPSEDNFRQYVEDNFPEFLDDEVFEVRAPRPGAPEDYSFLLPQSNKVYVYHPTFSADGKLLLTDLKREEEAANAEDTSQ
jgi:hypothetical protein